MADLVNVNVKVGGQTQTIKMEKGVTFENKGGIYAVDENGQLKKFDKINNVWTDATKIVMTNYQWKAFQNVANNDGSVRTYTKADIERAQEMYRKGRFTDDMSQDLPSGYKIEKPKLDSKQDYVQVNVTNGKESQSATLKFQIQEISELKAASKTHQAQRTNQTNTSQKTGTTAISLNDKGATIEDLVDCWEESEWVYGYTASKGDKTSYYDKNKKLVGTVETLPDGRSKYSDKNGECLYYTKRREIGSHGERHTYIYDNNSRLKYIAKTVDGSGIDACEEYGPNGEIIATGTHSFCAGFNELDYFTPEFSERSSGSHFRYGFFSISTR